MSAFGVKRTFDWSLTVDSGRLPAAPPYNPLLDRVLDSSQVDRVKSAVFDGTAAIRHHFVEVVMRRFADIIF